MKETKVRITYVHVIKKGSYNIFFQFKIHNTIVDGNICTTLYKPDKASYFLQLL